MKRVLSAILFLLLFLTSLLSGIADASPSLMGDNVSLKIYVAEEAKCFVTVAPGSATKVVGDGVEFTVYASTVAGQQWKISTDIHEQFFTMEFNVTSGSTGDIDRVPAGEELLRFSLTDLDWASMPGAIITDVLCEYTGNLKDNKFRQVSLGADFIDASFKGLHNGETYTFNIEVAQQHVPVPATMLLLGSGLVGIAAIRKKFDKQS